MVQWCGTLGLLLPKLFVCNVYTTSHLVYFYPFLLALHVSHLSLVYFFDYATITASMVTGWCVIAAIMLTSVAGTGYMFYLIERAKKCLDFSATLYIIHLFICIVYGGWPSSIMWWVVNGTGLALMALLGEYLCIRRELRDIPITRYRSNLHIAKWKKKEENSSICFTDIHGQAFPYP